ncbi:MAG: L,D-transpeptidase [Cyanobacteria bacterium P01_D01_bin.116]
MRYKLGLIIACCSMVIGCFDSFNQESTQLPSVDSVNLVKNIEQSTENLLPSEQQPVVSPNTENSQLAFKQSNLDNFKSKTKEMFDTDCDVAENSSNYMTLVKTGRKNAVGNPLYRICLYANGELLGAYDTVTGRAYTQDRNRNKSGTQAPAPDGKYKVAEQITYSPLAEMGDGRRFLQVHPQFSTSRSQIGLHYDPSFEKSNGQDGTSGCIALTNKADLDQVLEYFRTYRPTYMFVDIA